MRAEGRRSMTLVAMLLAVFAAGLGAGLAVAAAEGASKNAKYEHGVLVFTLAKTGLMYEASIGGQKFKYEKYD